ncbi:FAD-dependent oxidoreductase [Pelagibacteraceae bacterium]|nr:FAD-dependent oxidoreductase [Pelagibacteraceae bacterium]
MSKTIPKSAKAIVIGGGVAGCSTAYHLAKFGWKDTVLFERDQLTSGTTWHAAGLVSQLGPSAAITKIRKYSLELYKKLEKELEFSSGLKLNGALSIATTEGRWQELKRQATTAQLFNVNVEVLNIEKIKKIYPIINEKNILGGIFMPGDGQADPVGVTNLLAKGARKEGVKIFEKTPVEKILKKDGRVSGVIVNGNIIECEYIILATGMWSRQIGEDMGFSIPLYPAEHFYVITEAINQLPKNIPVLRDFDDSLYLKEDAGKMLIGIFEGKSIPAFNKTNRVPNDFSFGEFPENFEHFEPYLAAALKRVPILEKAGIRKFFAGPESFTPDTNTLLGEVPGLKNLFACCGLNSIGIGSGGGVGKVTAEWIMKGHINEDLFIYDIKRFQNFHSEVNFIKERITETLGDLYGMHWPYKQHKTSRNKKLFPYHEELKKAGACFGVSSGYERPLWFALNNEKPEIKYSYNFQNWYPSVEFETKNARENIGLFDLTAFSKYDLKGERTHSELQKICTANIKNEIGKTTYTQMLNEDGGIETDLTVVCMGKNYFRIVTSAANKEHDKFHILKYLSKEVEFKDVTDEIACLGIFGPKSRKLMSVLSDEDFSNKNFKFGTSKEIKINNKKIWVQRLSYVGELGFELYIKMDESKDIYNLIIEKGGKFNLSHCGMFAMDTMRMEKGYLHWGHDISPEENQYESGLKFAISFKKNIDFVGKKAIQQIKNKKIKKMMVMLTLKSSQPGSPLLLHDEPIYCEGKIVGRTTSGNYSFNYKKNMSFGYINLILPIEELAKKIFFVEVEKKLYEAVLQMEPLHDPKNVIIKN